MAQRITVAPHLSVPELEARERVARDPIERARLQVLRLLAQGRTSAEVAEISGYTQKWVRVLAARYNRRGPDALRDGRHHNPGQRPLLSAEQRRALAAALETSPPEGGLWSGPRVARWMSERLGRSVAPQRGWEALRRAGYTLQRPRPRHREADADAQDRFQAGPAPGA